MGRSKVNENTADIYNALAPYYQEYSQKKSAYLQTVDQYILSQIPSGANSLLDVGAGDGIRGMNLANQNGIGRTVLCDPSPEMAEMCKKLNPTEVWQAAAEELPDTNEAFDVIICLWNVLGHLADRQARVKALRAVKKSLSSDGVLFLDVNNRHNAPAYGRLKVFGRILIDFLKPDENRGNTEFQWEISGKSFPAMGHLFNPKEIEGIIKESGLMIIERVVVNYANGNISKLPWLGQLLYKIGKG